MSTMKAARYYGPKDIRIEQIPMPQAGPGQIKIKIAWNGICGSDLHTYLTVLPLSPTATVPNSITGETLPITIGHEFSGTISAIGEGVDTDKYHVDQPVVVEPLFSCMKTDSCVSCGQGSHNTCDQRNFIGIGGGGGGVAEYIAVDEKYVHILPEGISLKVGACIEPLAVAWHAVERSGFKKGDTALILGAGPIGLFMLKVLRSIEPTAAIIVSEPSPARRTYALAHGATVAHNPTTSSPNEPAFVSTMTAVMQATEGKGVHVAFDCAGIQSCIDAALFSVQPRGKIVIVAFWEKVPEVDLNVVLAREITVTGSVAYSSSHAPLLEALKSGKINPAEIEKLVTKEISIDDIIEQGFEALLASGKDSEIKILVHP